MIITDAFVSLAFEVSGDFVLAVAGSGGNGVVTHAPVAPVAPGWARSVSMVAFAFLWIAPLIKSMLESGFAISTAFITFRPVAKDSRLFTGSQEGFAMDDDPLSAFVRAFSGNVGRAFGVRNDSINVTAKGFDVFNSIKCSGIFAVLIVVVILVLPIVRGQGGSVTRSSSWSGTLESFKLGVMSGAAFWTFSNNLVNWIIVMVNVHFGA